MKSEKQKSAERPAISIVIHSWDTVLACVVTLVIGLVVGFLARPMVAVGTPASAAAQPAEPPDPFVTKANSDPKGVMKVALNQVKHFRGRADAPVTMLEFSDFQ